MCILYSLNYTVIKSVKTHAPQQVIWRESSKSLYSAVGTIFHLGGGGVCVKVTVTTPFQSGPGRFSPVKVCVSETSELAFPAFWRPEINKM